MPKQHKRPCATCPFTDKSEPGATGGSPVEVYVGQLHLPYFVSCHEAIDYSDLNWKIESTKCAHCVGLAMTRDAMEIAERMPATLLHIEHDPETGAFASIYEFWAHHEQITVEQAKEILTDHYIQFLCNLELQRGGARIIEPGELQDA